MGARKTNPETIDSETGLPVPELQQLITKGIDSPTVDWNPARIKQLGRKMLRKEK